MPKRIDKLTDQKIMESVPGEKPRKLFDGAGLYVMLLPSGLMSWRMKYHDQTNQEMTLTLGHYPDVSLELARDRSSAEREMLKAGWIHEKNSTAPTFVHLSGSPAVACFPFLSTKKSLASR